MFLFEDLSTRSKITCSARCRAAQFLLPTSFLLELHDFNEKKKISINAKHTKAQTINSIHFIFLRNNEINPILVAALPFRGDFYLRQINVKKSSEKYLLSKLGNKICTNFQLSKNRKQENCIQTPFLKADDMGMLPSKHSEY